MVRTHTICLDTHAVIWAYAGETALLGKEARALIAHGELTISPSVVLELQLLHEIGRVAPPASTFVETLGRDIGLRVATDTFADVVSAALSESWTRDPFDRLIVAHARLLGAVLLSRDRRVAAAYSNTRW